eukprot:CAMPEP_0115266828 /NCGR_PEP_ID=MMETSP0270-20121206/51670_1 /TAXON_ID=71861 /ORGANISM="Scrippsiella trochoidea, Strain CCMP3099" /LENGTH=192 /DNA_ID=CAMNT_0002682939 /DNA_START=33 /DNA_END=612 /DNA_ORIENTATION=+
MTVALDTSRLLGKVSRIADVIVLMLVALLLWLPAALGDVAAAVAVAGTLIVSGCWAIFQAANAMRRPNSRSSRRRHVRQSRSGWPIQNLDSDGDDVEVNATIAAAVAERKAQMIERLCPATAMARPTTPAGAPEMCAVCLEEKEPGEMCRELQCGHSFHAACIDTWWQGSILNEMKCPMCRQSLSQPSVVTA